MPTRQVLNGYHRLVIRALALACRDALDSAQKARATEARRWLYGDGMTLAMYVNLEHSLVRWLATLGPL